MKFPTIPHNFPWKTFREVFNRLLNGYSLENEWALESPYSGELGVVTIKMIFICLKPFLAVSDVRLGHIACYVRYEEEEKSQKTAIGKILK